VVFFVLITTSWAQVSYWENSIRLFEHALRVTDGNYVIHNNLGFELAHINYGSVLFSQGNIEESFDYYQEVLKARPGFAGVHYNFGVLFFRTGRIDAAVVHFHEALRIKPDYAEAYNSLGAAMVSKGKIPEAMAHFKAALQIKPDLADAGTNLKNLSAYIRANAKQKINIDFK
jgi:tetratricopeptide (TPR) repeat protein